MTVFNSYNCGVLGHHAERIAEAGLLGLCHTNAPASIAPVGGRTPVIGTNPIAVGVPDTEGGAAFVIDQSACVIARSEIMLRSRTGRSTRPGVRCGREPTDDPAAALKGSLAPARFTGLRHRTSGRSTGGVPVRCRAWQGCEPLLRNRRRSAANGAVLHRRGPGHVLRRGVRHTGLRPRRRHPRRGGAAPPGSEAEGEPSPDRGRRRASGPSASRPDRRVRRLRPPSRLQEIWNRGLPI